jgi:exo-1,4-beta-D-glucosaminidase
MKFNHSNNYKLQSWAVAVKVSRRTMLKLFISFFLFLCAVSFPVFAASDTPGKIELAENWKLISAKGLSADGAALSSPDYKDTGWHAIHRMPATVLEILQEDGVYPNLYFGENLLKEVPQDLYQQDWWYRTTFKAPAGHATYLLQFPGINYRAEIWLNGRMLADSKQIVGMYSAHELNVTQWIKKGENNTLAVKVTPEQALQDINGVELADSWFDWINWKYLGYQGPKKNPENGNSFVPDRNAGIWKPVYLKVAGAVTVDQTLVNSELPLPKTDSARLTIYANLHNYSTHSISGVLQGMITRTGKPGIQFEQSVSLSPSQDQQVSFDSGKFTQLIVANPDLWWPYTMGEPNLYDLRLEFRENSQVSDTSQIRFGIRTITQFRDQDEQFSNLGKGGNFYIKVNGRDFLIRGAVYTPDLLFKYDPDREAAILRYVKDMGLNMLRWESKISSEHIVQMADEQGIPVMFGWMCCNQWEKWNQWNEEDHRVSQESLRSQILLLRPHASVFIWANGSDGLPPAPVLAKYRDTLKDLHWQNATVDTVSSFAKDEKGEVLWDGIHMAGPYSWRPPTYWFSGRYGAARGSCAEQGDNEHIPPFASLKMFIPPDKLWPINETWHFHGGSNPGNATLTNIQRVVDRRYGASTGAEEFARKAQLAHYEGTRAQFEAFAANGWANHKMTIYWMLNSHWPSFFGNIFDYYLRPGGAYYGAKKGLRPLSVVFDSYATGDQSAAKVTVVNQTPVHQNNLKVRVRIYDLHGKVRLDRAADNLTVASGDAVPAMTLPRVPDDTRVFFVRCELFDGAGKALVESVYWQAQQGDDLGDPQNDQAFDLKQASWADMTALNSMTQAPLEVSAKRVAGAGENRVAIRLHNSTTEVAFFERAEILTTRDGDEILPIEYDDNYVTVFPGETVEIHGVVPKSGKAPAWVRVTGYNTAPVVAAVK